MSIVTFWNDDREQSGRTLTSVAVATSMAIQRNFKILLLSTSYKDPTMKNCFWVDMNRKNLKGIVGKNGNIAVENGIEGLSKLIISNKIQPNIITDYTRVIFKDRLEVLSGYIGDPEKTDEENIQDYKKTAECYAELIRTANQYYDMVLVDLDKRLDRHIKDEILKISNLNVLVITQRLASLNRYNNLKETNKDIIGPRTMVAIGKYSDKTKYNRKNITRYLGEKKELNIIPFNTLYFEAAEEASVADLFLRLRKIKDTTDKNYIFVNEVSNLTNNIVVRLKELQKRMR